MYAQTRVWHPLVIESETDLMGSISQSSSAKHISYCYHNGRYH